MLDLLSTVAAALLTGDVRVLTLLSILSVLVQGALLWGGILIARRLATVEENHLHHIEETLMRIDKSLDDHVLWHVEAARAREHREPIRREFTVPSRMGDAP